MINRAILTILNEPLVMRCKALSTYSNNKYSNKKYREPSRVKQIETVLSLFRYFRTLMM